MPITYTRQGKRLRKRCVVCPIDEPYERWFATCIRHDVDPLMQSLLSIYQLDDGRVVTSDEVEYGRELESQERDDECK